jgi:hypothetical protein
MAADNRPLDTDEFISHFEEMPSRVPEEKARGQRGKTSAIRHGVPGIPRRYNNRCGKGIEDVERAEILLRRVIGRRLTYRTANQWGRM